MSEADTIIIELRGRLERLTRERDEAKRLVEDMRSNMQLEKGRRQVSDHGRSLANHEAESLRLDRDEAVKALKEIGHEDSCAGIAAEKARKALAAIRGREGT